MTTPATDPRGQAIPDHPRRGKELVLLVAATVIVGFALLLVQLAQEQQPALELLWITLAFFGLKPDQTVVEITPGGGWYAEILAPYLREHGRYVAAVVDPQALPEDRRDYPQRARAELEALFAGAPAQFDRAAVVAYDPAAPKFGEPGSADLVVTFRNVHNWRGSGQAHRMFEGFFEVLREGQGLADRATFVVDPDGIIQLMEITSEGVGRNAAELVRKIKAAQYVRANPGQVCPAKWEEGEATLAPSLDLVGKL